MMQWPKLLSAARYQDPVRGNEGRRTDFQRDYDRIIFSSAFRRLQDKTQVHPLPQSDFVRRRLTHSLEVSSVGRSMGFWLGSRLAQAEGDAFGTGAPFLPFEMGQLVSNACLAHDIGNPPFGHAGEQAIASWFIDNACHKVLEDLTDHQRLDFQNFEGNAQGYRILTRLQDARHEGGLRLSHASLASFVKYPSSSVHHSSGDDYVGSKKPGLFHNDLDNFGIVASDVGLIPRASQSWARHPLVFFVEAADDTCYRVADIEDALKLGRISYPEAEECLLALLNPGRVYEPEANQDSNIGWLRANAIGDLIEAAVEAFQENEGAILDGTFSQGLLSVSSKASALAEAKRLVSERVFEWERTLSAEISGAQMITDVLNRCMAAIERPNSKINSMILKVVPSLKLVDSPVDQIFAVTDYISGMTDSYLRTIYLRFTGHAVL